MRYSDLPEWEKNKRRLVLKNEMGNRPNITIEDLDFVLEQEDAYEGSDKMDFSQASSISSNPIELEFVHSAKQIAEHTPEDNFGKRSEYYEQVQSDPRINEKTGFFGAASDVTDDLGWGAGITGHLALPFTMGPFDYLKHGAKYNEHMENISRRLEEMNKGNAEIIRSGVAPSYVTDNGDRDTFDAGMVAIEQGPRGVQGYLDQMDPVERETFIRLNNEVLHSELTSAGDVFLKHFGLGSGHISDFHEYFEETTGQKFNFGNQQHREVLGRFIASRQK